LKRLSVISGVDAPKNVITDPEMTKFATLDTFDRRLLALMRRDNQKPARIVAEEVGLSESAVLRRMRRLRETGVIRADVALVDPGRIAPMLTMQVLVEMKREGSSALRAFVRKLVARPEVVSAWEVAGETDFLITVRVPTMAAYEAFTSQILTDDLQVRHFQTLIGIREVVPYDPAREPLAD
jgi:Lrp/AsnC family leucine-responsive transcriptional regulator